MKLACVLLLFAFKYVLALYQENFYEKRYNYAKQIYTTNHHFGLLDEDELDELIVHLLYSNLPIDAMVILLTTPDNGDRDEKTCGDIEGILQAVIKKKYADIHEPSTTDISFNKIEITSLGDARRDMIYPSLKRIYFDVDNKLRQLDHAKVCNLIALLKSAKDPSQRVKEAKSESDGFCTTVTAGGTISYYKQYGDGLHLLDPITGDKGPKFGF